MRQLVRPARQDPLTTPVQPSETGASERQRPEQGSAGIASLPNYRSSAATAAGDTGGGAPAPAAASKTGAGETSITEAVSTTETTGPREGETQPGTQEGAESAEAGAEGVAGETEEEDTEESEQEQTGEETASESEEEEGEGEEAEGEEAEGEEEGDGEEGEGEGEDGEGGGEGEGGGGTGSVSLSSDAGAKSDRKGSDFLQATPIPRLGIATPFVANPPKPSLERSDEIHKSTGYTPEQHHANVRDQVQRSTQIARDAQRQMVSEVEYIANHTLESGLTLAGEIPAQVAAAIAFIDNKIDETTPVITSAGEQYAGHIRTHGVKTGEELVSSRNATTSRIFRELMGGSEYIEEANRLIQQAFAGRLQVARGHIENLPVTGDAPRIPLPPSPGGSGGEGEGASSEGGGQTGEANQSGEQQSGEGGEGGAGSKTLVDSYQVIKDFIDTGADASAVSGGRLKTYKVERTTPVAQQFVTQQEQDLATKQNDRARELDSQSNRDQFSILALGLTAPVATSEREDQNETTGTSDDQGDANAEENLTETERAAREIEKRARKVNERLEGETRDGFVKNLRKSGRKIREGLEAQAKAAYSALIGAAAGMADAYRDLVARTRQLIPPDRFLDARQLVPRLKAAAESARNLRVTHIESAQEQAGKTIEQLDKAKREQVASLWKQARQSTDTLGDVITQSQFDFMLFAEQMTDANTQGRDHVLDQARSYADRMAEQVVQSNNNMDQRGIARLDSLAVQFLNQGIAGAEAWQWNYLKAFEDSQKNVPNGALWQIFMSIETDLNGRADAINEAVPRSGASVEGALAATAAGGVIGGGPIGAAVGLGIYLFSKDADEDAVITQLGDLPWPGADALRDVFPAKGYGQLYSRLSDTMGDPEREHALDLLSSSAAVRGGARLSIAQDSTRWFGYNRTAREAALRGLSDAERGTLSASDIETTRTALMDDLNGSEEEISVAYLQGHRERALAARMQEAFRNIQRQGSYSSRSVDDARRRGDQAAVDALAQIEQMARTELAFETAHISNERLQQFTNGAYREFASMIDQGPGGEHRPPGGFSDRQAQEMVIEHLTAARTVTVGQGEYTYTEQVTPSALTEQYIRDVVRHGGSSEQAQVSRAAFEIERAEQEGGSISETTQMRLTTALEDPQYFDLVRREREATDPDEKARLGQQLAEARAARQQRLARLANRLQPEGAEPVTPEQAERVLSERVGNLFAREGSQHARYGQELITQGRASMEAGILLATDKWGTHEDLLLHTYQGRSPQEIEQVREDWQEHYGEDLDEMLGIREREWDAADYAALAAMPVLGPLPLLGLSIARGGETSGDLAMQLQRLAQPNRTDADAANMAALRYNQQERGTGFIADLTMSGTPQQAVMDSRRRRMGQLILAAAEVQDPEAAARFRADPSLIFTADGAINSDLRGLAFDDDGEFRGDRMMLHALSHSVGLAADSYQREVDRQESILTTVITVLTIAVSIALMFVPGVNLVAAGVLTALIGGAATMAVKFGMRGERYGWEEAAQDMAMTGIEAATAGIGGAMAGGLGKTGALFKAGEAINGAFGKVGGAMVREAITGAVSSAAQVGIQDETWRDGLGAGFDRMFLGGLKGAAVGAVSAGVSEKLGDSLDDAMRMGLRNADNVDISRMQRLGQALGPNGRDLLKEAISEGVGSIAGEGTGILFEVAEGKFKGGLSEALKRMGQAGLRDMVSAAGRSVAGARNRQRYQDLMSAARDSDTPLSNSDARALHLAAISAGVKNYDDPYDPSTIRAEVNAGRQALQVLPPSLREQAQGLDANTLQRLAQMLVGGDMGTPQQRLDFVRQVMEQNPNLDGRDFLRQMNEANVQFRAVEARQDIDLFQQKQVRNQLIGEVQGPARKALRDMDVAGLDRLSQADMRLAAEMIGVGRFDSETADALLSRAKAENPDLNEAAFLNNLQSAVNRSRQAQDAAAAIVARRRADLADVMPEAAQSMVGRMSDNEIAKVQRLITRDTPASDQQIDALYRAAKKQNPDLSREDFHGFIRAAATETQARVDAARDAARGERQRHMDNVPEEVRGVLSALPDHALVELRLRQMEGSLSPADRQRLIDAALRETPDIDVRKLAEALEQAVATPPTRIATAGEEAAMRRELLGAVPRDQQGELKDVKILVLPEADFAALTRSEKGQAVTMIIDGKPVVVVRRGADPAALREEGIHALQAKDPRWAEHVGALDERHLADWDRLSLEEQLVLYQKKMELEIDAQQRLIASLEADIATTRNKQQLGELQQRLELAQATLGNLSRRHAEVSGMDSLDVANIKAGFSERPQWLDQPARLFSKETEQTKLARHAKELDAELKGFETRDEAIARLQQDDVRDSLEPIAKLIQDLPEGTDIETIRNLAAMGLMLQKAGMNAGDFSRLLNSLDLPGGAAAKAKLLADNVGRLTVKENRAALASRVLDMAEIQKSLRDLEADGISPALRQELQDLILQGATPMEVFRSSHRKAYKERAAKVAEMANKLPPTSLQRISDRLNARGDFADVKPIGSSRLNAVLDSVNTYLKDVGGDFDGPVQRLFLDNPMGFSEALGSLTKLAQHLGPNSAEFRDAISIAMASKQTYDMLERLTSLAAAVKSSADAEQLMPKLKEYLAKALADGDEQWRDSLQRMGDITKKNGESMNADITQALQSGDAFAGVRPKAAVPEDLQGTKAKIEAVETEGAEPEAIKAAQEAASAEVRKWHDFLMGSFKTEDGRELAVADSYRKLVEFLQHKDGPHLSDADIQAGLRQALERLVREGKELTVDNVRHAVKDDFKRQLLTWTLTGDMGGTRSDFDPTDPRAVGESINRLNKLTELSGEGEGDNVALNPKDRANLTEEWHEIYKNGLKVEGEEHIGTQAVLREKENGTMVGEKTIRGVDSEGKPTERVVELPGTRSGERKPDFSDPPLLGDVKSHKDSLSGEDEIRLRAYLRAVSAENGVTVHVKGQKLDTPFDQVRVFFTDSQGVIASAQRLAALMNDYPDHFSFAFIHPVTGERHVIGPQSTNPIPGVPAGRAMTEAQLKAEIDRIIKGATPPS